MYRNIDTGEAWTEDEIRNAYESFRDESAYMSQFDSFEDYLDEQIRSGILELTV